MGPRDRPRNSQPETGAASLSIARLLEPVEWVERVLPKFFPNAWATIIDANDDVTCDLKAHIGTLAEALFRRLVKQRQIERGGINMGGARSHRKNFDPLSLRSSQMLCNIARRSTVTVGPGHG